MKFFIAKLAYDHSDLAHPWSLFAEDMAAAVARLAGRPGLADVIDLVIRERPFDEAKSFYGRQIVGPAAMHHTDLIWED